jgi:HPt (histidine-containing phosphotransfer) domain-containing protein
MNDCVGKPFTSHELWRCLMKYLKPVSWQPVNGIHHTQAEKKLRNKLITNFVKENKTRYSEFEQAISIGDMKLAYRIVHTLKGNAGQLGKTLLQQSAAEVEQQLKDGENHATKEQLETLESRLEAALIQLTAELETNAMETGEAGQLLDEKASIELIEKLEPLLQTGNTECLELMDSLNLVPENDGLKAQLIQQMEDLEFEQAVLTLAVLKKKIMQANR